MAASTTAFTGLLAILDKVQSLFSVGVGLNPKNLRLFPSIHPIQETKHKHQEPSNQEQLSLGSLRGTLRDWPAGDGLNTFAIR